MKRALKILGGIMSLALAHANIKQTVPHIDAPANKEQFQPSEDVLGQLATGSTTLQSSRVSGSDGNPTTRQGQLLAPAVCSDDMVKRELAVLTSGFEQLTSSPGAYTPGRQDFKSGDSTGRISRDRATTPVTASLPAFDSNGNVSLTEGAQPAFGNFKKSLYKLEYEVGGDRKLSVRITPLDRAGNEIGERSQIIICAENVKLNLARSNDYNKSPSTVTPTYSLRGYNQVDATAFTTTSPPPKGEIANNGPKSGATKAATADSSKTYSTQIFTRPQYSDDKSLVLTNDNGNHYLYKLVAGGKYVRLGKVKVRNYSDSETVFANYKTNPSQVTFF